MWLKEIWRYPVKSMAGESLAEAGLGDLGIAGDRLLDVRNGKGRLVTARTRPALLRHRARLAPGGEPLVDGQLWQSAEVARAVQAAAGADSSLARTNGVERFDVLPLLVATDGAIAAFGHDRRRLRPNLVIGGVEGLDERRWEGRVLRVGNAVVGVHDLRQRCVVTTFDPDTLEQDTEVLRGIQREFGGSLALNCFVRIGGVIRVGDPVELSS